VFPLRDNIPTENRAYITYLIIAINVVVFLFVQKAGTAPHSQYFDYGALPCDLTGSHAAGGCPDQPTTWITPITSMFMHGGWLHIIGNMLFLYIFGNNVEDSMGHVRFVVFYLLGGICALALQSAIDPSSAVPTIGASGAIAGVLGGYLVMYPRARVLTGVFVILFFTLIEIPALWFLLIWIGEQVLFAALDLSQPTAGSTEGVAYFAHIGGFAFGMLLIHAFAKRRNTPRVAVR
jgi:membrane associated rhomboid family serine protease